MKYIKQLPLELIFWITALLLLLFSNPNGHHFSLCFLANLGFEKWCPGCGLGRSIISLFHGDVNASFAHHWFGIPALLLIVNRIYQLSKQLFNKDFNIRRISNV